ncbi:MAG TPA: tRNA lysidine(34) synthetase TilS [Candidatus Binatia bacterium]|nr:tRNA lysidine(34) synthetase TilS [Candidatus Binatia bacterium]
MTLDRKVKDACLSSGIVCAGDRVLVAVSGGPDSVALLQILHSFKDDLALHLEVAHVEHGIRGEEAKKDAAFVEDRAKRLGLRFHLKEANIPDLRSRIGKGNLEELARRERYRFFLEVAERRALNKIATAHTEDDQAETVLMWLLRGSGRRGLGGIAPSRTVHIDGADSSKHVTVVRPMLGVAKREIIQFLREEKLEFCFDRSNLDTAYLRNWLRHDLLPRLKQRGDSRLSSRLAQTAEVLREESDYLEMLAEAELDRICANEESVSRSGFLRHPRAMQRQLLRLWIRRVRGHLRGLDFDHIETLLRVISGGPAQSRFTIPGGWELSREYEQLRLLKAVRGTKKPCYTYSLVIGTPLLVPEADMTIESRLVSKFDARLPKSASEALFDLTALPAPLVVRNFRRGDRFQPLGMAGHKKVKDLFIQKKAPLSTRAVLPLLVTGDEVLWVPGYGRSEIGRIGPHSKEILHLDAVSNGVRRPAFSRQSRGDKEPRHEIQAGTF